MGRRTTRCRTATSPRTSAADRKSTRLNSSHSQISYAVFCLKKKKHLHQSCQTPIPVAFFGEIATAGPIQVIRDQWNSLPLNPLEHEQTTPDRLLSICLIRYL